MLSSKQKRELRAQAHGLSPVVHIGKEGLTANLIQNTEVSLEAHELIKLQVLKHCPNPVMEIALDLASHTHSDIVQTIGRTIVLYRKSARLKRNR
jgi:RNA-binding protein